MVETEIKLRWPKERGDPIAYLAARGYRIKSPRTLESDQLFDRGDSELAGSGRVLRLRRAGSRCVLTYKGPPKGGEYKVREEIEVEVSDGEAIELVLDRLGYHLGFRYEKYRTVFFCPEEQGPSRGIVTVDETPIGLYLELEGEEDWIDAVASTLQFTREDFITRSYRALYLEFCVNIKREPSHMTFDVLRE